MISGQNIDIGIDFLVACFISGFRHDLNEIYDSFGGILRNVE